MNDERKLLEGLKPCPRCHSTEHLHIEIVDDCLPDELSAKVCCTECHISAQRHYIFNGTTDDERPSDVQLTREVIEQWNETCDDWEGMSDRRLTDSIHMAFGLNDKDTPVHKALGMLADIIEGN